MGGAAAGEVASSMAVDAVAEMMLSDATFAAPEGVTGFNDICATAEGTLLVGGLRFLPFAGEKPVPGHFWHVTSADTSEVVVDDVLWPNGVGDNGEGVWCCNDYTRGRVNLVEGGGRRFIDTPSGEADGLAFDEEGGVWVAQPRAASLVRLRLDGTVDQTVELPGYQPASVAFDGDTMYVTTISNESKPGQLLRIPPPIPGRRHHLATI